MAYLNEFTKEQQDLLIALPYRVGLWISLCDSTGGEQADEAEMQVLEALIVAFAEDFCKSEFVEEVMVQTLARRDEWSAWQENVEAVVEECTEAVSWVAQQLPVREVTFFKHNLMEIAVDVAMAFREVDYSNDLLATTIAYSRYYLESFIARLKKVPEPSLEDILNISPAERAALKRLSKALRENVEEGLVSEPEIIASPDSEEGDEDDAFLTEESGSEEGLAEESYKADSEIEEEPVLKEERQ